MGEIKCMPESETSVREWFAAHLDEFGYSIIFSGAAFPDLILEKDDAGQTVRAEVESKSSSFVSHGHDPKGCDLVICWIHDSSLPLPVLELSTGKMYASGWQPPVADASAMHVAVKKRKRIKSALGQCEKERTAFLVAMAADLRQRDEWSHFMQKVRLELLSATRKLLYALQEHDADVDDMHPDELLKLLSVHT